MSVGMKFDKNGVDISPEKNFTQKEVDRLETKGYYFHAFNSIKHGNSLYKLNGYDPKKAKGYIMNIQELKAARDALEEDLLHLIDARVDKFKRETGMMVESVGVDFRTASVVGGDTAWFVNGVRVGMVL